eukprot:TRINITY_DN2782_c0_g1_i2.p1 TRINITY_DN2782_c0_g1~~TRINITY_DN2782_c0_g1_i2.p1  ORF type:complete len:972 (+),score=287.89 TRINITY_DN2782_c0_g1_i2:37-2952(+)
MASYSISLIQLSGESIDVTLTFESVQFFTLEKLFLKLGINSAECNLQVLNTTTGTFQPLSSDKDLEVGVKTGSKLKVVRKPTKKELKKEKKELEQKEKQEKKNKDVKKGVKTAPSYDLFGVSLAKIMERCPDEKVPPFIKQALDYLKKRGASQEEGIFRVPGSTTEVEEIKKDINKKGAFEPGETAPMISSVAGVVKLFFREMPESVIDSQLYFSIIDIAKGGDPKAKVAQLKTLIANLQPANRNLLLYLLRFLKDLSSHADKTKMNTSNLAMVWAPNLIKDPPDLQMQTLWESSNYINSVVNLMIDNVDAFMEEERPHAQDTTENLPKDADKKAILQRELSQVLVSNVGNATVSPLAKKKLMASGVLPEREFRWEVTPKESEACSEIFRRLDTDGDGFISTEDAARELQRSLVDKEVLMKIITLADRTKDQKFDEGEFVIADFLIRAKNQGKNLPMVLPDPLVASAYAGKLPPKALYRKSMALPSRPEGTLRSQSAVTVENLPDKPVNSETTDFRKLLRRSVSVVSSADRDNILQAIGQQAAAQPLPPSPVVPPAHNQNPSPKTTPPTKQFMAPGIVSPKLRPVTSPNMSRSTSNIITENPAERRATLRPVSKSAISPSPVAVPPIVVSEPLSKSTDYKPKTPTNPPSDPFANAPPLKSKSSSDVAQALSPQVVAPQPARTPPVSPAVRRQISAPNLLPPPPVADETQTPSDSDWKQAVSSQGKIYYYNKQTKETTWKNPFETPAASDGKGEWKEVQSPDGKNYYYNTVTKLTSWVRPAEEIAETAASPAVTRVASAPAPTIPAEDKEKERRLQEQKLLREQEEALAVELQLLELERQEQDLLEMKKKGKNKEAQELSLLEQRRQLEEEEKRLREEEDKAKRTEKKTALHQRLKQLDERESIVNRKITERKNSMGASQLPPMQPQLAATISSSPDVDSFMSDLPEYQEIDKADDEDFYETNYGDVPPEDE